MSAAAATFQKLFLPVYFIVCPLYLYLMKRFLKSLQESYPDTWRALGEPEIFANVSTRNTNLVLNFFSRRGYASLGDRDLTVRGDVVLVLLYTLIGGMLVFMLAGLIARVGVT